MGLELNMKEAFRSLVLFGLFFIALFVFQSLGTVYNNSTLDPFNVTLDRFQSDFDDQSDFKDLSANIIQGKKRFLSFGAYIKVPRGQFHATFYVNAPAPSPPVSLEFQIAAEKGRTIVSSNYSELDAFPTQTVLAFKIPDTLEIEPRVEYISGNTNPQIERVVWSGPVGYSPG